MTFLELAEGLCHAAGWSPDEINLCAATMEHAYCQALRRCSYRIRGIDYLFDGPNTRTLNSVIEEVMKKRGPI